MNLSLIYFIHNREVISQKTRDIVPVQHSYVPHTYERFHKQTQATTLDASPYVPCMYWLAFVFKKNCSRKIDDLCCEKGGGTCTN